MNDISFEEWFKQSEAAAQELVATARGSDAEIKVRIGTYLMAFIGLAKIEGIPLRQQLELLQGLHPRIVALDGRKAASA